MKGSGKDGLPPLVKLVIGLLGGLGLNEIDKRFHYMADGYNRMGFDRDGYDRDGYDKDGFNRQGFDRDGFDRKGYDAEGYDRNGFDINRYDRNGRDKYGYDRNGIDTEGYDRDGYDSKGYDKNGQDRAGHDKQYYANRVTLMEKNIGTARVQLRVDNFRYALSDIRVGIEQGVKDILSHKVGKGYESNRLDYNIGICEKKKIMEQEFIEKLYSAKNHCNLPLHEDIEKNRNQVYFCWQVLREITEDVKNMTGIV